MPRGLSPGRAQHPWTVGFLFPCAIHHTLLAAPPSVNAVVQRSVHCAPEVMTHNAVSQGYAIKNDVTSFEHDAMCCSIGIEQRPGDSIPSEADGTGRRLWPTSLVLARYLCEHPHLVKGKRVVELGAGTGSTGIASAALGAKSVVLTDMPEIMTYLQGNVARNAALAERMSVMPCMWGDEGHLAALMEANPAGFDVVLAVEVVYKQDAEVLHALAALMARLAPSQDVLLLMAYEFRGELFDDLEFFDAANELFDCSTVSLKPWEGTLSDSDEEERYLYMYRRKAAAPAATSVGAPDDGTAPERDTAEEAKK